VFYRVNYPGCHTDDKHDALAPQWLIGATGNRGAENQLTGSGQF
jgi:hypothetical protein